MVCHTAAFLSLRHVLSDPLVRQLQLQQGQGPGTSPRLGHGGGQGRVRGRGQPDGLLLGGEEQAAAQAGGWEGSGSGSGSSRGTAPKMLVVLLGDDPAGMQCLLER